MSTGRQKIEVLAWVCGAGLVYLAILAASLAGIVWFVVWLLRALGVSI